MPNKTIKQNKVKISEKNNIGRDEIYCNWYRCPKCRDVMITSSSRYCTNCGIKLIWKK